MALIFFINDVKGQYFSDTTYFENAPGPKLILKTNVLTPIAPYSTVQLSLEQFIRPKLSIQYSFAIYIPQKKNSAFDWFHEFKEANGAILRSELRHYFSFKRGSQAGYYVAGELAFSYLYNNDSEFLGVNCLNRCEFQRRFDFRRSRRDVGMQFKIGKQRIYDQKVSIGYFIGIGYKYKMYQIKNIEPAGIEGVDLNTISRNKENRVDYNMSIGLTLGLLLK